MSPRVPVPALPSRPGERLRGALPCRPHSPSTGSQPQLSRQLRGRPLVPHQHPALPAMSPARGGHFGAGGEELVARRGPPWESHCTPGRGPHGFSWVSAAKATSGGLGGPKKLLPPGTVALQHHSSPGVQGTVARRGGGGHPRTASPSVLGEQGQEVTWAGPGFFLLQSSFPPSALGFGPSSHKGSQLHPTGGHPKLSAPISQRNPARAGRGARRAPLLLPRRPVPNFPV